MRDGLRTLRSLALVALVVGPVASLFGACASGGQALPGGGDTGTPDTICLLNNCVSDLECGACDFGKRRCLVEEGRCVACDPLSGTGCAEGEICTRFGACVASGAECPTDERGEPLITCLADTDCLACDPLHQVCDTETSRCVACTPDNTSACQSTDACVAGRCQAECPSECTVDADCASCVTGGGHAATVCNAHKCSECSDAVPCPAGEACSSQGTCVSQCGSDGEGSCDEPGDCSGCYGGFLCHGTGPGTCGPNAASCAQLGTAAPILPAPWDVVVKACTTDSECAGLSVKLNIGAMLRDITGVTGLGDADYGYDMGTCADVTVAGPTTCGVCVPCEADADCEPIDTDLVGEQLFGPAGSVEASYLTDQVFGPNPHVVYTFCEKNGPGYGVCSVCPGYLNDCRVAGGGMDGVCEHDACTTGGPLGTNCDECAQALCAVDDYCCTTAWDQLCVNQVAAECAGIIDCGGTTTPGCTHSECVPGPASTPLVAGCSPCVDTVCAADAFCCTTDWDPLCVSKAVMMCGSTCTAMACAHSECEAGPASTPLADGCSPCVTTVCDADPFCCSTEWDSFCVTRAEELCPATCPP
ncbi:MAG TPA: hypothetical protein VLS89_18625 [Candidatus Nanopelagicales bacterium]|nr:hypothetical protein [Candidatus Nanopelagicales bacterium]